MLAKYVCHSRKVWKVAARYGWLPGARYTNLRDVRDVDRLGLLDINWKNYDFKKHLDAAIVMRPRITVANDIVDIRDLPRIIDQAYELNEYSDEVIIVPKDVCLSDVLLDVIPSGFVLGYSVPTKYGGTLISPSKFGDRKVHLLGGRPDRQRELANLMNVSSLDTNRFTLDATFGDYFDGKRFVRHPVGGYERCIEASLDNINAIWRDYSVPQEMRGYSNDAA